MSRRYTYNTNSFYEGNPSGYTSNPRVINKPAMNACIVNTLIKNPTCNYTVQGAKQYLEKQGYYVYDEPEKDTQAMKEYLTSKGFLIFDSTPFIVDIDKISFSNLDESTLYFPSQSNPDQVDPSWIWFDEGELPSILVPDKGLIAVVGKLSYSPDLYVFLFQNSTDGSKDIGSYIPEDALFLEDVKGYYYRGFYSMSPGLSLYQSPSYNPENSFNINHFMPLNQLGGFYFSSNDSHAQSFVTKYLNK